MAETIRSGRRHGDNESTVINDTSENEETNSQQQHRQTAMRQDENTPATGTSTILPKRHDRCQDLYERTNTDDRFKMVLAMIYGIPEFDTEHYKPVLQSLGKTEKPNKLHYFHEAHRRYTNLLRITVSILRRPIEPFRSWTKERLQKYLRDHPETNADCIRFLHNTMQMLFDYRSGRAVGLTTVAPPLPVSPATDGPSTTASRTLQQERRDHPYTTINDDNNNTDKNTNSGVSSHRSLSSSPVDKTIVPLSPTLATASTNQTNMVTESWTATQAMPCETVLLQHWPGQHQKDHDSLTIQLACMAMGHNELETMGQSLSLPQPTKHHLVTEANRRHVTYRVVGDRPTAEWSKDVVVAWLCEHPISNKTCQEAVRRMMLVLKETPRTNKTDGSDNNDGCVDESPGGTDQVDNNNNDNNDGNNNDNNDGSDGDDHSNSADANPQDSGESVADDSTSGNSSTVLMQLVDSMSVSNASGHWSSGGTVETTRSSLGGIDSSIASATQGLMSIGEIPPSDNDDAGDRHTGGLMSPPLNPDGSSSIGGIDGGGRGERSDNNNNNNNNHSESPGGITHAVETATVQNTTMKDAHDLGGKYTGNCYYGHQQSWWFRLRQPIPHGWGRMVYDNGGTYDGQWYNGYWQGRGILWLPVHTRHQTGNVSYTKYNGEWTSTMYDGMVGYRLRGTRSMVENEANWQERDGMPIDAFFSIKEIAPAQNRRRGHHHHHHHGQSTGSPF